ncbi:unnamed protein product [Amoebophrya sp. A25]|nr:unnamed protein product [Amoebophrya sp. A25]|eukprot:GSA25T00012070001.1
MSCSFLCRMKRCSHRSAAHLATCVIRYLGCSMFRIRNLTSRTQVARDHATQDA